MSILTILDNHAKTLTEGSMLDRLKREAGNFFDPAIGYAGLAFKDEGIRTLRTVYSEYMNIGLENKLTFLMASPTWKVDRDAQARSELQNPIQEVAEVMSEIKADFVKKGLEVYLAGRVGPKNDCYLPEQALTSDEAYEYHALQIEQLAMGSFDLLDACTLPALSEALGIARLMSETQLPYNLSFVIRANSEVLDGNSLANVIQEIDSNVSNPPSYYMINCVHPQTAYRALEIIAENNQDLLNRIRGFQGNTSPRDPLEFSQLTDLEGVNPEEYAEVSIKLYQDFGIHILGGCCGTNTRHIRALAGQFNKN